MNPTEPQGREYVMLGTISKLDLGAYDAARTAALSGVPRSTVYDWARKGVVTPSISETREKLWSYRDLLDLRLVRWLRIDKPEAARSPMAEVRAALERFGDDLWREAPVGGELPTIAVTAFGAVVHRDRSETASGQRAFNEALDLFEPFGMGVDLRRPDSELRIVPGRCAGEPHLVGTRLMTKTVAALAHRGFDRDLIAELYPDESRDALVEAVVLEDRLAGLAA